MLTASHPRENALPPRLLPFFEPLSPETLQAGQIFPPASSCASSAPRSPCIGGFSPSGVSFGRSTVRLANDQNQKNESKNTAQGKMIATSVRGTDWQ
jgi:hypothetical protein